MLTRPAVPLLLAVHGLLALKAALVWSRVLQGWLPSVAVVPLPFLLAVVCWLLMTRLFNSSSAVPGFAAGRLVVLQSWIAAIVLYAGLTLRGADASYGRWLTVAAWIFCCSTCSVATWGLVGVRELISRYWKLRLMACGLGLGLCGCTIFVLECVSGWVLSGQPLSRYGRLEGTYLEEGALFRSDHDLGRAMHADRRVSCRLLVKDNCVWDVHYSTDQFGRRRTVFPGTTVPNALAVFFGCSVLFGEGCEDRQTIPSVFCRLSPGYLAANYGVPGWGPQHMLSLLQSGRVAWEAALPVKLGVFLYRPELHEARVVGDMDVTDESTLDFPCYRFGSESGLYRAGSFRTAQPLTNLFYDILRGSQTRTLLGLNFPRRRSMHYRLTAAIIAKSRELFLQSFPDAQFLVVVCPGGPAENLTVTECRRQAVEILNLQGHFHSEKHSPDDNVLTASAIVKCLKQTRLRSE